MTLYLRKAALKPAYLTVCDRLKFVCKLVIVGLPKVTAQDVAVYGLRNHVVMPPLCFFRVDSIRSE